MSGTRPAPPAPGPARAPLSVLPLVALCLGQFMVILDVTVVTVAEPALRSGLGAGPAGLQWVVDGYTTVFAGLLLLGGGLGDRFGHRRLWLGGLGVFAAASAACALAPATGALIAARFAQGVGAALLIPASLALLSASYPDRAARARAVGIWGGVACTAAAAGPVVGGVLVEALGWRSVFWLNVPVAAAAVAVTLRHIGPVARRAATTRFDLPGLALGVATLLGLAFGLNEAGTVGWASAPVLGGFAVAVAAAAGFVAVARRRGADAVLPLGLFRRVPFSASALIGVVLNLGFYGLLYLLTLYFQQVRGYSATTAGLALLPCMAMGIASSPLSGRIAARTGPYLPMRLGLAFGTVGFACWLVAGPHTPYWALLPALVCCGIGTPLCMPAATSALMEAAPRDAAGVASAVFNVSRQTGSTVGVALFGTLAAAHLVDGLHAAALVAASLYAAATVTACLMGRRG
ncbi:MFS transporter [Mangrovactinospora gilvigrisea]|uniref:MFS transporter n=1 Tax=Mangrovactinospora gilvigrisea TaxID=1428644 RepID=A0A1J7C9Y9_9ACTN|nr:MFS transporter [Mangrovactinospora gilvigrisea]